MLVGGFLVLSALILAVISLIKPWKYFTLLVFFFGVWGGVELGRYLEYSLSKGNFVIDDKLE